MNELKQEIKSRLLEKLDHSMEMEDEAVQELVENEVCVSFRINQG